MRLTESTRPLEVFFDGTGCLNPRVAVTGRLAGTPYQRRSRAKSFMNTPDFSLRFIAATRTAVECGRDDNACLSGVTTGGEVHALPPFNGVVAQPFWVAP